MREGFLGRLFRDKPKPVNQPPSLTQEGQAFQREAADLLQNVMRQANVDRHRKSKRVRK